MVTRVNIIFKQMFRHCGMKLRRNKKLVIGTIVIIALLGHTQIYNPDIDGLRALVQSGDTHLLERHIKVEAFGDTGDKSREQNTTQTLSLRNIADKDHLVLGETIRYFTNGYERADYLRKTCTPDFLRMKYEKVRVLYNEHLNVAFCPLCKIASTFWTRVFKMLEYNEKNLMIKHPFEIDISDVGTRFFYYNSTSSYISMSKHSRPRINAKNAFKFLFVRNPFNLLLSAFVDKIVGPNPTYWKAFETNNVFNKKKDSRKTCGADLQFGQFLQNIVQKFKINHTFDCHVSTLNVCQPCAMNYTFVGQLETFKEDTFHILSKLNQNQTLEIFEEQFSSLHADDAIDDSTAGPFSWKRDIIKCIPWSEALQRIWRKLQIRGIIGMQGFPLTDTDAEKINKTKFIKLLKQTRNKTTSKERRWQKEQAFIQAYQIVPSEVLNDIRRIYARQFKLFGYDDMPTNLFKSDTSARMINFFDFSNIKENFP